MKKSYKDFIKKFTWWGEMERTCGYKTHILYIHFNHSIGHPIGSVDEFFPDPKWDERNNSPSPGNYVCRFAKETFQELDEAKSAVENDCRKIVIGIFKMYKYYLEN